MTKYLSIISIVYTYLYKQYYIVHASDYTAIERSRHSHTYIYLYIYIISNPDVYDKLYNP